MIHKAFTIFDSKTELFGKPFFCTTSGEAVRTFSDAVNDQQGPFFRHAEDYVLFEIGTYDDAVGVLDSNLPVNLGNASTFKIEAQNG